jgi:hypothetical protein
VGSRDHHPSNLDSDIECWSAGHLGQSWVPVLHSSTSRRRYINLACFTSDVCHFTVRLHERERERITVCWPGCHQNREASTTLFFNNIKMAAFLLCPIRPVGQCLFTFCELVRFVYIIFGKCDHELDILSCAEGYDTVLIVLRHCCHAALHQPACCSCFYSYFW